MVSVPPVGSYPGTYAVPAHRRDGVMEATSPLDPGEVGGSTDARRASSTGESFGAFLGQALEQLGALERGADDAAARLAAGEPVDLHNVIIATEEASVAFQLALQLRNKAVEAYQEIMRMQV